MNEKAALRTWVKSRPDQPWIPEWTPELAELCRPFPNLLAFLALPGEPDPERLLQAWLDEGKTLWLPRLIGAGRMAFYPVDHLAGPWEIHRWGLKEPLAGPRTWSESESGPAVLLVPGLAFDRAGGRLGRGGGFYDRFLAGLPPSGLSRILGLCPYPLDKKIPLEPHDIRVQGLLTKQGLQLISWE